MNSFWLGNISGGVLSAVFVTVLALNLHSCSVEKLKDKHKDDLKAAAELCTAEKTTIQNQCDSDKLIPTGASNAFQLGLITRDNDVADGMRGNPEATCYSLSVPAGSASGSNAADKPNEPRQAGAINRAAYTQLTAQCETDRLKVIGLQKFICDTWYSRKAIAANDPLCRSHIAPAK